MNIYLMGVILSILAYIIVGIYAGRKVKNVSDYYVSGRNAPTLLIAGTLFASMLSTNGFMGDTGYSYGGNITTMILLNVLCATGYIFGPMFFGRYIRRAEINTMPSYFGKRFNSTRIQRLTGVVTVISLTAYLLAVIQGTGLLMQSLTGLDRVVCLLIAWACFTSFTFYSGSSGVILTDTMMFLLFLVATIIGGPYIFNAAFGETGGLANLVPTLMANPNTPEGLLNYHGNPGGGTVFDITMYAITVGIIWLVTVGVSPWQAGRNLMARNEHVTFRSGAISAICTVIFLTYLYLMAISVIQLYPNMAQPERVIIWAALNVMPQIIGVAVLAGIMAAGLSSASTFLSVVGFSVSSDVFDKKFRDDKHQLSYSRNVMLVVSLIALIISYFDIAGIRIISWFASTLIAATWGYVAFASVWDKKLTERGAFFSMIGGFFGFIIPRITNGLGITSFSNVLDPFFIGVAISIAMAYIGNKGQTKTAEEIAFQAKLHVIPKFETVALDYKRDFAYGRLMVAAGVIISIVFIVFWAIPFNA